MALTVAHTTSTAKANNPAYDISANAWNGTNAHTIVSTPLNFTDLNTLEQYNSTNAQTLNIYNTYTDANNYERLSVAWSANAATIKTAALGTGTVRDLHFGSSSGGDIYLDISATNFIFFGKPGNHFFNIDGATGTINGNAQTATTNAPILNLSQTWNNVAVAFTAIKVNVTNTASAAGSKLLDLQLSGNSIWNVGSGGANLANSTTAQSLRVYNTTDGVPTNYERAIFDWTLSANVLTIGTQAGGTGTARGVKFISGATTFLDYGVTVAGLLAPGVGVKSVVTGVDNFQVDIGGINTQNALAVYNAASFLGGVRGDGAILGTQVMTNDNATAALAAIAFGNSPGGLYLASSKSIVWTSSTHWWDTPNDTGLSRVAAGVLGIGNGASGNVTGWVQWGGQARVTSDFNTGNSTTLTNVTGLSVTVAAGRTYHFETELYLTDAAAGGAKAAIAGTATATAIQYTGYMIADNAIKAKTNATALATAVASSLTTETAGIIIRITGTITVNAAGTLTVQLAQNTGNATGTVAKQGSYFIVHDMP